MEPTSHRKETKPLVSLRDVADEFNAGKRQLRTDVEVHVGDAVTRWALVLDGERAYAGWNGDVMWHVTLRPADAELTPDDDQPGLLTGLWPRNLFDIVEVFGIGPDARIWTKGSIYAKE